jgi:hypothetical protein
VVAVVRRIRACVAAGDDASNGLRAVVFKAAEEYPATFVGIGLLSVLTESEIGGLRDLKHRLRSEVRGQIAEVKPKGLAVVKREVFTSAI